MSLSTNLKFLLEGSQQKNRGGGEQAGGEEAPHHSSDVPAVLNVSLWCLQPASSKRFNSL